MWSSLRSCSVFTYNMRIITRIHLSSNRPEGLHMLLPATRMRFSFLLARLLPSPPSCLSLNNPSSERPFYLIFPQPGSLGITYITAPLAGLIIFYIFLWFSHYFISSIRDRVRACLLNSVSWIPSMVAGPSYRLTKYWCTEEWMNPQGFKNYYYYHHQMMYWVAN